MMTLARGVKVIVLCSVYQGITGFTNGFFFKEDVLENAKKYVQTVNQNTKQSPELVGFKESELREYTPYKLKSDILDPFAVKAFVAEKGREDLMRDVDNCESDNCGDGPPTPHTPYFLENYNLDELVLTGTINNATKGKVALIQTPDSDIVYTAEGEYLGRNHGLILSITREKVIVREKYRSSEGWKDRMATLHLIRN